MTDRFSKEVQGVAIYLEFRKYGSTCQVLITPEGLQETGETSFAQFFRRTISAGVTKRKWQSYALKPRHELRNSIMHGTTVTSAEIELDTNMRISNISDYLSSVANRGYKLVKDTPIYVEVTKSDMTTIRKGEMPAKLWTRVKSSRTTLGFPSDVVDMTTPTVVASAPAF